MQCRSKCTQQESWDTWGLKGHSFSVLKGKARESISSDQGFECQAQAMDFGLQAMGSHRRCLGRECP